MGRRKLEIKRIEDKSSSVERIISRYEQRCLDAGEITTNGAGDDLCKRFATCKELLQTVDRVAEENNHEELSVNDMTQLEQELDAALVQTRLRKVIIFIDNKNDSFVSVPLYERSTYHWHSFVITVRLQSTTVWSESSRTDELLD
ncbi:hypothetical protein L1987_72358 [Smallanthus sonchifolius]|uniref:Uncharacterized protein n=1 Tax=Smallanthus sonchifolius TaxID=185202 RepID=A0ACB9AV94_9ASTR|nr:hypothetical protein L1987_72358 [Smallanthus sonchifolius]